MDSTVTVLLPAEDAMFIWKGAPSIKPAKVATLPSANSKTAEYHLSPGMYITRLTFSFISITMGSN